MAADLYILNLRISPMKQGEAHFRLDTCRIQWYHQGRNLGQKHKFSCDGMSGATKCRGGGFSHVEIVKQYTLASKTLSPNKVIMSRVYPPPVGIA